MNIAFFGDTHGHLDHMFEEALAWQKRVRQSLDAIVQVGDFGIWPNIENTDRATRGRAERSGRPPAGDFPKYLYGPEHVPIPTYFCRGNHEMQEFLRASECELEKEAGNGRWTKAITLCPKLYYIPDGHVVNISGKRINHYVMGGPKEENGYVSIAALGGNFGRKTWESGMRYDDARGRRMNHITRDRHACLLNKHFDILITHDAPIGSGVEGRYHNNECVDEGVGGCAPIRDLIDRCQPRYHFNGHWHQYRCNQFDHTTSYVLDKVEPGRDISRGMVVLEL